MCLSKVIQYFILKDLAFIIVAEHGLQRQYELIGLMPNATLLVKPSSSNEAYPRTVAPAATTLNPGVARLTGPERSSEP